MMVELPPCVTTVLLFPPLLTEVVGFVSLAEDFSRITSPRTSCNAGLVTTSLSRSIRKHMKMVSTMRRRTLAKK